MTDALQFIDRIGDKTGGLLDRFFGPTTTESIFTTALESDETTVITAAAFERIGGFGWGGGAGNDADGDEGGGGGGGGGGRVDSRPVAVVRVTGGEVTVTPIVDVTKVAVTFLVAAATVWKALR